MNKNKNRENQFEDFNYEIAEEYLKLIRKIVDGSIDKYFSTLNIETYKDLKVIARNTIYEDEDKKTISHYTYDVKDLSTKEVWESLLCKSSDTINVGDYVRVYFSDIEYIGFKL